jgi:antirestriction protein ArdC
MAKPEKKEWVKRDTYQEVTDRVIASLEAGKVPWHKPWNPDAAGCSTTPRNAVTGKKYRGLNTIFLAMEGRVAQTEDPRFCTYKQAEAKGWQVRKGEKGTTAVFAQKVEIRDKDTKALVGRIVDGKKVDDAIKEIFVYKTFTVFHASQIDGIPKYVVPEAGQTWRKPEAAAVILKNSGVEVRTGGESAYYSPDKNLIQLPPDHAFTSPEAWAATAMHELGHATGHPERLNRPLNTSKLSTDYAKEELRAELCSVFIGTEIGLPTNIDNHAAYIGSWLQALRDDKREIFRAASEAQRMADYCLGFHPEFAKERAQEKAAEAASERDIPQEPEPVAAVKAPSPSSGLDFKAAIAAPTPARSRGFFISKTPPVQDAASIEPQVRKLPGHALGG